MYDNWEDLKSACYDCKKCGLCETRTNLVFGVGNPNAEVMFIGEGPGEQEDLKGEPFVGRGGQLLDKMLAVIDLDRKKNIYIGNMVKCRPPKNRDPKPEEQEQCIEWLRAHKATYTYETIHVQVNRLRQVGPYDMAKAENPIYIVTCWKK